MNRKDYKDPVLLTLVPGDLSLRCGAGSFDQEKDGISSESAV